MSAVIDQPQVTTPADEWAESTNNMLHSKSQLDLQTDKPADPNLAAPSAHSVASTPGIELPGAFPKEALSAVTHQSGTVAERSPQAALDHLADAAPPKTTAELQETAKGYIPDVQTALETAKSYLPQSIVSVLRECSLFWRNDKTRR